MPDHLTYTIEGDERGGDLTHVAEMLAEREDGEPEDGATFAATKTVLHYLACPRQPDGTYHVPPCDLNPVALSFGEGQGWFEEMLISCSDAFWKRTIWAGIIPDPQELKADEWAVARHRLNDEGTDPVEYIACIRSSTRGTLTYHRNPPRLTWREGDDV